MAKKAALEVVEFLKEKLERSGLSLTKIIVFGSQVHDRATAQSDIDIIVVSEDFKEKSIFERAALTKDAEIETIKEFLVPLDIIMVTPEEVRDNSSLVADFAKSGQVVFAA